MRVGCLLALSAATLGSALEESSSATPLSRSLLKQKLKAMFDARDGVGEMDEFMSDEDLTHLYHSLLTHGVTSENGDSVPIPLGRKQGNTYGTGRSLLQRNFDSTDKQYVLDLHNEVRNLTAKGTVRPDLNGDAWPSSSNMNMLFWDDALASVAQAYSDQCIWEHNGNRNNEFYDYTDECSFEYPESGITIGENLAYRATTGSMEVRTALYRNIWNGWYEEYDDGYYDRYTQCDGCGVIGHYTQMVWSETRYLGCGFTICSDTWDGSTAQYNYYYLVCNYYSAGNYRNQYPYESGEKCSNCDADREVCSGGLCGFCMYSGWDNNGDQCNVENEECADQCSNNLGVTYSHNGDVDESDRDGEGSSSSSGSNGSDGNLTGVVVGVCVGVLMLFVCVGIGVYFYKQREGGSEKHQSFLSGNHDAEAPRGVVPAGDTDPYKPPVGYSKSSQPAPQVSIATYVRPY